MKNSTKVKFAELDGENKLTAISQMFYFKQQNNWPSGAIWNTEEDLQEDLEHDYNPEEHFTFYLNEFEEVETKIG